MNDMKIHPKLIGARVRYLRSCPGDPLNEDEVAGIIVAVQCLDNQLVAYVADQTGSYQIETVPLHRINLRYAPTDYYGFDPFDPRI